MFFHGMIKWGSLRQGLAELQAGVVLEEIAHGPLPAVGDEAAAPKVLQQRRVGAEGQVLGVPRGRR